MLQNSKKLRSLCRALQNLQQCRSKLIDNSVKYGVTFFQVRGKKNDSTLSSLFVPVQIKANSDDINVGAELTGSLNKADLLKVLNKFYQNKEIKQLLVDNGLDSKRKMQNFIHLLFTYYIF